MLQKRKNNNKKYLNIKYFRVLPALFWIVIIFYSGTKKYSYDKFFFEGSDKIAHALTFGFLNRLVIFSFLKKTYKKIVYAFIFSVLYGIFIEVNQIYIPGRKFDLLDIVANISGCILFVTFFLKKNKR